MHFQYHAIFVALHPHTPTETCLPQRTSEHSKMKALYDVFIVVVYHKFLFLSYLRIGNMFLKPNDFVF